MSWGVGLAQTTTQGGHVAKLRYHPEATDSNWKPPYRYRTESSKNLLNWWQEVTRKAGALPPINVYTQRKPAELVIAKIGYVEAMRTLAFMGTPQSRYFQYPFGIGAVLRGHAELLKVQTSQSKTYAGWIGPTGLKNLGENRNEDKRTRGR